MNDEIAGLVQAAAGAAANAYAPYSGFRVGAALASRGGAVFTGANVENASYGLSLCAERTAIFSAVAAGRQAFEVLVIYTPTPEPTVPCGACRQVLAEFDIQRIVCACDGDEWVEYAADELLPNAFALE